MELSRAEALNSLRTEANGHRVICELLRLVYDEVEDYNPDDYYTFKKDVTELLVDAFIAAKKMDARLHYYQEKYQDTTGKRGRGLPRIPGTAERRAMRRERVRQI